MLGVATPPVAPQFHDPNNGWVAYNLKGFPHSFSCQLIVDSYSISHAVDHQQNYQLQQHGFDPIGLAENVYSPTKSRRRANKIKNAATNAMNAYEFPVSQPVNPYAQTGDMFFPQTQSYTPLVVPPFAIFTMFDFHNGEFC